ncbi:MAG: 2-hydroxyacid dehydrogenase [Planctomycetota bacterium]
MVRPRVYLTRELPAEPMRLLRERTVLTMNAEDRPATRDELLAGVRDAEGLLCMLSDTLDAAVMDAAPSLKGVANYAVGYNNIDLAAAAERGIVVTNTPGVLTDATADLAFALLLAASRRIVEGDALVRSGRWRGWGPVQLLGADLAGATLGIVGAGRIGRAVARRARGFDMHVLYWNRHRLAADDETVLGVHFAELDDLLSRSDVVSLHVALAAETRHLIDAARLGRMKPTAVLVNTARGAVVDEAALARALADGTIAAAGLDVYEHEPRVEPTLLTLPNVVLAPHLGSAAIGTRTRMGVMAVENVLAACQGRTPPNVVDMDSTD